MANQLASFDPVSSFQRGAINRQTIQSRQQSIDAQPLRNELAQFKLGQAKTTAGRQDTQFNQQQSLQRATIINQSAKALAGIDPSRRAQAFALIEPKLAEFGIDPGTFDPNQLTDENLADAITSTSAFLQTGDPASFQKGATALVQTDTGQAFSTSILNPRTGEVSVRTSPITGKLISNLGETPQQTTQRKIDEAAGKEQAVLETKIDLEPTLAEKRKFAELTGSSRAKAIDSGVERIQKIDVGIANIDDAIAAVQAGAGVGAIESKFPSLKAASVELDNIQGRMALDVIGGVTFGALSKGELDLAKSVALPTGLDGPQLIQHLVDKKAAQQKLRDYFSEQIDFLDQGGTVAQFLRKKERDNAGPQEGDTATNPQTGQKAIFTNGQWVPANG